MVAASSSADNAMEKHDVFLSFRGTDTRRGFTSHLYEALDRIKIQTSEAELVKLVVSDVLAKLNRKSQIQSLEGLVGIEKHIQKVEGLLSLDSHHVIRTIGIWGMGGIGKTTVADVVFHRLAPQFKDCCFLQNVRERSKARGGLQDLRDHLFRSLLKDENLQVATPSIGSRIMTRLSRINALVVLDDVSDSDQVEFFTGVDGILFGPGSRIITTARNKRMLGVGDAMIYEVKELDCDEALDLFHLRALRNLSPSMEYENMCRELVDYAGGNPLALTVLGSVFSHCRSKEDWEGELQKLKKYPDIKIQNVLRLSYDGLEKNEEGIFHDIACCHRGKCIDEAKRILEGSGFSANAGVRLLIDMSLISVDDNLRLQMHDLIQEMGQKIVNEECDKNPGKRSRLWLADEVGPVLKKNKGTEAIECIVTNMDNLEKDLHVNAASFEKMDNLRLLDIHSHSSYFNRGVNKVHLPPVFEFLPDALTYLRWHFYPLTYLPSRFSSQNLVELHMQNSRLERLWHKDMQIELGSLKRIDFSLSKDLAELPDLSESPNLESIKLEGCSSLVQLPSTLQHNAKLTHLLLQFCSSLKILPEMPRNLEVLLLLNTEVQELPSSIWSLEKLRLLGTDSCRELKNLPTSTCSLNSLRSLDLQGCCSLESLPVELPAGLEELHMRSCKSVRSLHDVLPSELKRLFLDDCNNLVSLPFELPTGLRYLSLNNCTSLAFLPVELPAGIEDLVLSHCENLSSLPVELPAGLRRLYLRGCNNLVSLPKLPWVLQRLDAQGCTSLKTVSSSTRTIPLQGTYQYLNQLLDDEKFDFRNCLKLDQTARSNIMADAQFRMILFATTSLLPSYCDPFRILCPGNEIPNWMQYQSEECLINIRLPPHWCRQGFLGFVLCIVFELHEVTPLDILFDQNHNSLNLVCQISHKINDGLVVCSGTVHVYDDPDPLNSDHVLAWYFCPEYVKSETSISSEDWVDASFDFLLYIDTNAGEKYAVDVSTVRLKRCGVSLLYAKDVGTYDGDAVMEVREGDTSLKPIESAPAILREKNTPSNS